MNRNSEFGEKGAGGNPKWRITGEGYYGQPGNLFAKRMVRMSSA